MSLKAGVEYEWFLVIVPDPVERSADFLASATMKYVKPPGKLGSELAETLKNNRKFVYAANGYWYDMISSLFRQIEADEHDTTLISQRKTLLESAGMPMAAACEAPEGNLKSRVSNGYGKFSG